jgi:hypothetical protein
MGLAAAGRLDTSVDDASADGQAGPAPKAAPAPAAASPAPA